MHPDLFSLHAAVTALLRANRAVQQAARAYGRASRRPWSAALWFRDSVLGHADPEVDALHRATARQREAAGRVSACRETLSTDYPRPHLPTTLPTPNHSFNGNPA